MPGSTLPVLEPPTNPSASQKVIGAYYTPNAVVSTLVSWAVQHHSDRLLDPACGDGRFVAQHANSVGVDQDPQAVRAASSLAPHAMIHEANFFEWAAETNDRFECASGNPPFIRYQTFNGDVRRLALRLCSERGVRFSGLTSSWAPFLAVTASLLKSGGRLAFVVPAEIGHAPYSAPLLDFLARNFATVHVIAIREKLFPALSEDCWLLYADGFGARTSEFRFSALPRFAPLDLPPPRFQTVSLREWRHSWNCRLRSYLLPAAAREFYRGTARDPGTRCFGEVASIGIGYVTGANDFFHLRPSLAERLEIPPSMLAPTVRNGRALTSRTLTHAMIEHWRRKDDPVLLLRIQKSDHLPVSVRNYLDTDAGYTARSAYKCRSREPWYCVPDVRTPDFFLSCMSGREPTLVHNEARCTCTNSVHGVRLRNGAAARTIIASWESRLVMLSCEIEGHPLGGGMLKLEPREASRILLPLDVAAGDTEYFLIEEAISCMREWRHYGNR